MMEDHKTVVKFYDGAGNSVYRDLFKRGEGRFFCHHGAEYLHAPYLPEGLYPWHYRQVVAQNEPAITIDIKGVYELTEDYHLVGYLNNE